MKKIVLKKKICESDRDSLQHKLGNTPIAPDFHAVSPKGGHWNGQHVISPQGDLQVVPTTWIDQFRHNYYTNRGFTKTWFWDNFDWSTQSIWIGKFTNPRSLPENQQYVIDLISQIIANLKQRENISSQVFIKFYYSRHTKTGESAINCFIICDSLHIPDIFKGTLADIMFESYKVTKQMITQNPKFKDMLDHYIAWNDFHTYYNLIHELGDRM